MIKLPELLFQAYLPVDKHVSKKNDKVIRMNPISGKRYIGTSTKTANELKKLGFDLIDQKISVGNEKFPIEGAIQCKLLFHYPDIVFRKRKTMPDIMKKTKKVIDLSNLIQGIEDCLQSSGIISDDKQIESYDGSRRIYGSKEPAIEVFIYRYDEEQNG